MSPRIARSAPRRDRRGARVPARSMPVSLGGRPEGTPSVGEPSPDGARTMGERPVSDPPAL